MVGGSGVRDGELKEALRLFATLRKDRRVNIRLSSKDLEAIQKPALAEGLPYQTLISSLLHKYASGRLKAVMSRSSRQPLDCSLQHPDVAAEFDLIDVSGRAGVGL